MNLKRVYPWFDSKLKISEGARAKSIFAIRVLVGALFVFSGFSKLIQSSEYFEVIIGLYDIVPERMTPIVAMIFPWLELVGGVYLLLGYWVWGASRLLACLAGIFQLVLAQALLRRLPVDECGCFGGGFVHLTLYQSFVLDTVLVLLLLKIAAQGKNCLSLDNVLLKTINNELG